MSLPTPTVTVTTHPNGSVTAVATDHAGHNVTIAAGPGTPPWLVRLAMRGILPKLMPGARVNT